MEKELYIIRHAETDLNKQGIVQGQGVDADINALGKAQAKAFHQAYRDIPFDRIYISELKRTYQTIEAFIKQGIPYEQHAGLNEISWGIYEGKAQGPESKADFNRVVQGWEQGLLDIAVKGGETPLQVQRRLQGALEQIMLNPQDKTLLICMHGRVLRIFLCMLLDKPLTEMNAFPHQNTALYRLQYQQDAFQLLDAFNTSHLESLK